MFCSNKKPIDDPAQAVVVQVNTAIFERPRLYGFENQADSEGAMSEVEQKRQPPYWLGTFEGHLVSCQRQRLHDSTPLSWPELLNHRLYLEAVYRGRQLQYSVTSIPFAVGIPHLLEGGPVLASSERYRQILESDR